MSCRNHHRQHLPRPWQVFKLERPRDTTQPITGEITITTDTVIIRDIDITGIMITAIIRDVTITSPTIIARIIIAITGGIGIEVAGRWEAIAVVTL